MLVELYCLLRALSGRDQMTHCPRWGLVALLTARPFPPALPATHAWGFQSTGFLSATGSQGLVSGSY